MKILIATHNRDKLKEISEILKDLPLELFCMDDFPMIPEVVEDRDTIEGNAMKKALETSQASSMLCLADDTGLFIEALNGDPGVYSARFAGEKCSYLDNRLKVLKLMENQDNRASEFRTAVALAAPDGIISLQTGIVKGYITGEERGSKGFGYDAIFALEQNDKTYAELPEEEKNRISHRALAFEAMRPVLKQLLSIKHYN